MDGQFCEEIGERTCSLNITGNYQVKGWSVYQSGWPHFSPCCFPKPARDGMVDMLIGVDKADLHLSMVDLRAANGGPVARPGPLGWTCVVGLSAEKTRLRKVHMLPVRSCQGNQMK